MGLLEMAGVPMMCGLMTHVVPLGAAAPLARRWGEPQLASGAALGLESSSRSLGQIANPLLVGVLIGSSVVVPFWLASELLLVLAPIFAWRGRHTHETPSSRAAKGNRAFRRQEAR
jgi:hypothetical protein